jgi:tetratricopeptide (TPR) repeat protein
VEFNCQSRSYGWAKRALLAGVVAVFLGFAGWYCGWRPVNIEAAPPPLVTVGNGLVASSTSESCRECHEREYGLWASSHHVLAERAVQPDVDRAAFEPGRVFKTGSVTNQARIVGGGFQIVTLGFKTNIEPYQVERVIGHDPVRQFLTAAPGGRWQVLEATYESKSGQWFDVYGDEDRQPGEWGHWTGRGMNWNSRCADCHNTRLHKNYEESTDSYHTVMVEAGVGCASCHPSMSEHVIWQRANRGKGLKDPALVKLNSVQVLEICGSCHSRREEIIGNFTPGDSFFDHYQLEILDESDQWYADGQVHGEDYEFASFLGSKMMGRGVTCLDCHNPNSVKTNLPGNSMCMRCHSGGYTNAPVINPVEHGHHGETSAGSECVGCHMPVTVYMQRHPRHDHGFTIPDPLLTKELNIPNACTRCHADKSVDWAVEYADKWYGAKMNRSTRDRARMIAAAKKGEARARLQVVNLLTNGQESAYWRAVAAGLLWQWADAPEVKAALLARLKDTSPLVREKAVNSLESMVDSNDGKTIQTLKPMLEDSSRNVRVAAAWLLKSSVDAKSRAGVELQAMLDFNADQPAGQYRKAMFDLARQQPSNALAHLRKGIAWDPFSPPLRLEAAEVLTQLGRFDEAANELHALCRLQPTSAEFRYKLGLALAESHQITGAADAFKEAVKLDPQHTQAWYNLGLALDALGQVDESIAALKRAESLAPKDPQLALARARVLARAGRNDEAKAAAMQALIIQPDFPPARQILESLAH